MLKLGLPLILLMSYSEWFLRTFEMQAVYPFSATHVSPADAGLPADAEHRFETADGENLVLWIVDGPGPVILYFPGNAGNLAARAARFRMLSERGFALVAVAYRGSSGSSGEPSEDALSADGLEIFDQLDQLLPNASGPVVLYGESLGTAVATKIAVARQAQALILEAPFTSVPALAEGQYPDYDLSQILTQIWDTESRIAAVEEPLLILHGDKDKLVPFEHGQRLYRKAGSKQKTLHPVTDAGHQGLWTAKTVNTLYAFLDRL